MNGRQWRQIAERGRQHSANHKMWREVLNRLACALGGPRMPQGSKRKKVDIHHFKLARCVGMRRCDVVCIHGSEVCWNASKSSKQVSDGACALRNCEVVYWRI